MTDTETSGVAAASAAPALTADKQPSAFVPFATPQHRHAPPATGDSTENGVTWHDFVHGVNAYFTKLFKATENDTIDIYDKAGIKLGDIVGDIHSRIAALELEVFGQTRAPTPTPTPPIGAGDPNVTDPAPMQAAPQTFGQLVEGTSADPAHPDNAAPAQKPLTFAQLPSDGDDTASVADKVAADNAETTAKVEETGPAKVETDPPLAPKPDAPQTEQSST